MRKCRLYSLLRKTLSALLCLSMMLSIVTVTDFSGLFHFTEKVKAADAPDPDEYKDETLEHVWDNAIKNKDDQNSFWNASRPYYAANGQNFGGITKQTIFHVYAFEGDTICVGSSVNNSTVSLNNAATKTYGAGADAYNHTGTNKPFEDEGSVDVVMTDLNGNKHAIDIHNLDEDKTGYIGSPGMEYAAIKMECIDGEYKGECEIDGEKYTYTPYTYKIQETGIYTFEFHSYDKGGTVNPDGNSSEGNKRSEQWATAETNYVYQNNKKEYRDASGMIAAINLTVFNENGEKQTGRTYADVLSLQMGNVNQGIRDPYYILTTDSYIYKMQFNGASPYTYNFFSNNSGIVDRKGDIVYKSVKDTDNGNTYDEFDICYRYPGTKDTDQSKSFFIFLEYPDDDLYGHLYERALLPDPAEDIQFIDTVEYEDEGGKKQTVPGSYTGLGGWFEFRVGEATTATLRLEFKNINKKTTDADKKDLPDNYAPVEISGVVTPNSRNRFYWDGCDGNGVPIPPGQYSIEDIMFTVTAKAGEIHFPIIDMENAKGGITFTRLSHIYDKSGTQLDTADSIYDLTKSVIYYDDTAIYYGEQVTATGTSENKVTLALKDTDNPWKSIPDTLIRAKCYNNINNAIITFFDNLKSTDPKRYWTYNNMRDDNNSNKGGEYISRENSGGYISKPIDDTKIRVGDHSHTTNIITYFDEEGKVLKNGNSVYENQKNMIKYLDSKENPVGKSTGTGIGYIGGNSTESEKYYVYDNVKYAQSTTDYGIANFWAFIPAKPEVAKGEDQKITIVEKDSVFNLIGRVFYDTNKDGKFQESSTDGEYAIPDVKLSLYKEVDKSNEHDFKNHTYVDASGKLLDSGTIGRAEKVYESVASEKTTLSGNYIFKGLEYDPGSGTEYLYKVERPNVSYNLTTEKNNVESAAYFCKNYAYGKNYTGTEIQIIKVGGDGVDPKIRTKDKSENPNLTVCAADVGYYYQPLDHSVTLIKNWKTTETHPDTVLFELSYKLEKNNDIKLYGYRTLSGGNSWQVKEENLPATLDGKTVDNYFVSAEYYIVGNKVYKQSYDFNTSLGKYESFVGKAQYAPTSKFGDITSFSSLSDLTDLNAYNKWQSCDESATYKAVLDRDMRPDNTNITITNSTELGTIEILKYVDSPERDENLLAGATFRVYEAKMATIKKLVDEKETAELTKLQRGSGTTRSNGRIAFPGLNPSETYTVRERYAPDGYRILEEFYEIKPKGSTESGIKCFDANNYVELQVGNALADTDFKIRKRISGRAWQTDDSFTFTITPAFDASSLKQENGFVIDDDEETRYSNAGKTAEASNSLKDFVTKIKEKQEVIIKNDNPYYSSTSKNINDKEVTISSSDTKVSESLLTMHGENAAFIDNEFPLAGTYTFTVKENPLTDKNTLDIDPRTYTVTILVRRELDNEEDPSITLENSHLVAEVLKITYTDKEGDPEKVFAGSSPIFTNIYAPAPAEQDTSYEIVKNFTGRNWKNTDQFTINIEGIGTETQDAVKNKQLTITGLGPDGAGKDKVVKTDTGWTYTVPTPASGTSVKLPFTSFQFNNIIFPVEYVDSTGKVWETPTQDDITNQGLTPQTRPVTYWLSIEEKIPEGASENVKDGITYDKSVYYLQIILRNAEETVSTGKNEEEDGIIDEIEMNLYHSAEKVTDVNTLTEEKRVATCHTTAVVFDNPSEWLADPPSDDGTYTWFYVQNDGKLVKASTTDNTPPPTTPTDYKLLVRRREEHKNTGTGGHTMTINNEYHMSFAWSPTIKKTLEGRDWTTNDKFTFTIEADSDNPSGCSLEPEEVKNLDITQADSTDEYKKSFDDAIVFTQEGIYKFTITEKDKNDLELGKYNITVEVEDDGKGKLKPTIKGFEDTEITSNIIEFTNTYSDTSFNLNIAKTIEGRKWGSGDEFTFKITPDFATKKAIDDGTIVMPAGDVIKKESDGSYTITLNGSAETPNPFQQVFGKITIKNTGERLEDTQYNFTVEEVTSGLKDMYCREPKIELYVTVNSKSSPGTTASKNELVATFAHVVDGDTTPGPDVTIPFTNVAAGKLTVAKKVVSNSETDETAFRFNVEFKYYAAGTIEKDRVIKAVSEGGTEITPVKSSDENTWTYTFDLKDGEKVEFSNIPPKTEYKITETIKDTDKENYMLLRVCDTATDNGIDLRKDGTGESVNDILNPDNDGNKNNQYRLFVNGLIRELPSAGGGGIDHIIFLGTAFTVSSILLIAMLFYKRRRRI